MRAFSSALDAVPLALAENSGLSPIETLAAVKSRQVKEGNSLLGIDCNSRGENGTSFAFTAGYRMDANPGKCTDMKKQFVYDPLISKRQQYLLATQLVRAVLKIGTPPSPHADHLTHIRSSHDQTTSSRLARQMNRRSYYYTEDHVCLDEAAIAFDLGHRVAPGASYACRPEYESCCIVPAPLVRGLGRVPGRAEPRRCLGDVIGAMGMPVAGLPFEHSNFIWPEFRSTWSGASMRLCQVVLM